MPVLTDRELARDQRVFRGLKRHRLADHEKHELLALTKAGYRVYQARLLELAKQYGIRIQER